MQFKSAEIKDGKRIPTRFTADGINISPSFKWKNEPKYTQSFSIIVDDPDAVSVTGTVSTHFAAVNIPSDIHKLSANQDFSEILHAFVLPNDTGDVGWHGPNPPPSKHSHRYFFNLYALSIPEIPLKLLRKKLTADIFENEYKKYILASAHFVGKY